MPFYHFIKTVFDPLFRAENICVRYPNYVVRFHGVGPGPIGQESKYHTQIAVFMRHSRAEEYSGSLYEFNLPPPTLPHGICTYHKRVDIYKPYRTIGTTLEFSHFTDLSDPPKMRPLYLRPMEMHRPCEFYKRFHLQWVESRAILKLVCPDEPIYCTAINKLR